MIPDPYFGGNKGFKKVLQLINDACDYHSKVTKDLMTGNLYLIPTTLGDVAPLKVLPISVKILIEEIDTYIVESESQLEDLSRLFAQVNHNHH